MNPFALDTGGWSFVVLPDTQYYCQDYPAIFQAQTDWIIANQARWNIQAVLHVGDIVHRDNVVAQWDVGSARMAALEAAGIPCGVASGNHDVDWPVADPTNFLAYFGAARYAALGPPAWYGGHRAGDQDYWITWTVGGQQWIAIFLGWDSPIEAAAVTWARGVMAAHPAAAVIIVNHYVIASGYTAGWGSTDIRQNFWEKLYLEPNLAMVLCGHVISGNLGRRDETVTAPTPDRHTQVLFANWQEIGSGGDGWMRLHIVEPVTRICGVTTFSPWLGRELTDFPARFVVRV